MKKGLFLLLLITGMTNAQIVNIPDANFKAKLLRATSTAKIAKNLSGEYFTVDANNDGEIQESEAINVSYIYLYGSFISDLTGIEAFLNLKYLSFNYNQLTSVDLSQNINLEELYCSDNQLSSLDLTKNINLKKLHCSDNQLPSLDLTKNIILQDLYCNYNNLTILDLNQNINLKKVYSIFNLIISLDVTQNVNLEVLDCSFNQLVSLDVTKSINLKKLYCRGNQLTSLDVTQNLNLQVLNCGTNQLTNLDISKNIILEELRCSHNQLTSLDITQNTSIDELYCSYNDLVTLFIKKGRSIYNDNPSFSYLVFGYNPNLKYICTDEEQVSYIQEKAGASVMVNSYCFFTPGGSYNTITGSITFDADKNGCETGNVVQTNIKIDITDGINEGSAFTNHEGNYTFYVNSGSFDIQPNFENPSWFVVSPETATISFDDTNSNLRTQNFCVTTNDIHDDVEIIISPITPARPGFDADYKVVYKNKGNQNLSGVVDLTFDDTVLDYVSASISPDSQSTGNLSWNYTDLLPFESRSFEVTLNVNSPMETPAVNNDDILNFIATINPIADDEMPEDNVFEYKQTVVGSYDPNDITCLEGNVVSPDQIGKYLHYLINFENTGTAEATFVVVKDIVDLTQFDIDSIQILDASHTMETKISDGKLEFIFDNINLGANEKGNITFKIKSLNTLVTGDNVTKKADIYFDYNFPIETNLAITTFEETLFNQVFKIDESVSIFPNPAKDLLNINVKSSINSIEIYDVQGRIVSTKLIKERNAIINLSNFVNGIYFLKVTTEFGVKLEKIIKE